MYIYIYIYVRVCIRKALLELKKKGLVIHRDDVLLLLFVITIQPRDE